MGFGAILRSENFCKAYGSDAIEADDFSDRELFLKQEAALHLCRSFQTVSCLCQSPTIRFIPIHHQGAPTWGFNAADRHGRDHSGVPGHLGALHRPDLTRRLYTVGLQSCHTCRTAKLAPFGVSGERCRSQRRRRANPCSVLFHA